MALQDQKAELPDSYLVELGRITVRWATFESILDLTLMTLAGLKVVDATSLVIFTHMNTPQKLDVMAALINERRPFYPLLENFSNVLPKIKQAAEERNKLIHAKWGVEPSGEVQISRITARGKLVIKQMPVSIDELKKTSDLIYQAADELFHLVTWGSSKP